MKWKPTSEECRWIREAAKISAGTGRIRIEVGERFNLNRPNIHDDVDINIARITDDPEGWEDTDLNECLPWERFRKGVELTEDGRAIVDFYVYELSEWGDLRTNVTVEYRDGAIRSIDGTMNGDLLPRVRR